jgi:glycogen synthase
MKAGMARDFSWDASAKQYRELYHSLGGTGLACVFCEAI